MKRLKTRVVNILIVLCLVIGTAGRLAAASVLTTPAQAAGKPREMNIGGYLSVGHSQAPASFNAGYSIYTAAWPLVEKSMPVSPKTNASSSRNEWRRFIAPGRRTAITSPRPR